MWRWPPTLRRCRLSHADDGVIFPPGRPKRRQTDGRWLMHLDIWNSSPATPPAP